MAKPMVRTQVNLPQQMVDKLESEKKEKGISKAETIRRALEEYFEKDNKE